MIKLNKEKTRSQLHWMAEQQLGFVLNVDVLFLKLPAQSICQGKSFKKDVECK